MPTLSFIEVHINGIIEHMENEKTIHAPRHLRALVALLALLFSLDTVRLIMTSSFTLGTVLMILVSSVLILLTLFFDGYYRMTRKGVGRKLSLVLYALIAVYLCFLSSIYFYGNTNVDYNEDVIIVLGGGLRPDGTPAQQLRNRLDGCVRYCRENPDAYVVVSGGLNRRIGVVEADSMADYLIRNGVDPDMIIKETRSTSTRENLEYTKAILDERGIDYSHGITVVTNNYHIFRARYYALQKGFDNVTAISMPTGLITLIPSLLRESCAISYMLVFGY